MTKDLPAHLASYLKAGQTPADALRRLLARERPDGPVASLLQRVESGQSLYESACAVRPPLFSKVELALLHSGETSGELPEALQEIANLRRDRKAQLWKMIFPLLYPLVLVHMVILVYPADHLKYLLHVSQWGHFILLKLFVLGPLYGLVVVLFAGWSFLPSQVRETLVLNVPGLRQLWRAKVCRDLARVMSSLLRTELGISAIWELAAESSASPRLLKEARGWKLDSLSGHPPPVERSRFLPSHFIDHYLTGASTGNMDEQMQFLHTHYKNHFRNLQVAALAALGATTYLLAALLVAIVVVRMYQNYLNQIMSF